MNSDILDIDGERYIVTIERDDCMGAPWDEHGEHGVVSEWTSRTKAPGDLVLCEDRGSYRYYDFAGAVETAKRDGWGVPARVDTDGMTPKQVFSAAARADYEYLRGWCLDHWCWVCVVVRLADSCPTCGESASLGGIESDATEYLASVARDLAVELRDASSVA